MHYARIERELTVRSNPAYEQLVIPNGNGGHPVHRWFRLKEAFSRDLLPQVVKDLGLVGKTALRVVDPFAGSGTTAIAASQLADTGVVGSAHVVGYECNPFLHLVASTKLRALQEPTSSFLPLAQRVAAMAARRRICAPPVPELATFATDCFFPEGHLDELLRLGAAIDQSAADGAPRLDTDLARLCLGATIETTSFLRRDGRALRYVPDKQPAQPVAEFLRRAEEIDSDLPSHPSRIKGGVRLGDGRRLAPEGPRTGTVDLVVFSPPYPNNIDYTEVYKMEAWLLGFISNQEQFSRQRLQTVYSHPSILRTAESTLDVDPSLRCDFERLLEPVLEAVPVDRYRRSRAAMLSGYFLDMLRTLQSSFRVLKPGGHLVYVVGNSVHGADGAYLVVAADILIARLAVGAGFRVESINVARRPHRRRVESQYLRESVVFASKPERNG